MKKLDLRMWRDLWRMRWRALAIILTLASSVAVYVGVNLGVQSLYWTRDTTFERLHFADLEVRFVPEEAGNLPELSDLEGVERIERRLVFPAVVRRPGNEPMMAVMTFLETPAPEIHSFQFLQGRSFRPDQPDEVVIERGLSRYHGYRMGESLEVQVGEKTYVSRIAGIAISPEYFVSTSNPDYFVPEKGSLGIVFGNLDRVSDALGFVIVNDLLFRFKPGADHMKLKQAITDRLGKLNVEQVIPRERHFSHRFIQTELRALQFLVPALVITLMSLAFVITLVNFVRMVTIERAEIGALMALGHDGGALLSSYLKGSLVLGMAGGLLGLAISFPLRNLLAHSCAESMGMAALGVTVDYPIMVRGLVYALLIALASAALPVLRLVRMSPQQVIRGRGRSMGSRRWTSRALLIRPSGLSVSYRYGLRNLLRQGGRSMATLVSIALALAVAAAYRMSAGSIDETLNRRYAKDQWHLAVDFLYPVFMQDIDEFKRLPGVEEVEPYFRRYVELEKDGRVEDSALLGINSSSQMSHLPLTKGRGPRPGNDREIAVSLELAQKLGAQLGDLLQVRLLNQTQAFRLVGCSSDVMAGNSIVSFAAAQEICQLPDKASGVFLRTRMPSPQITEILYQRGFVGRIFAKDRLLDQIRDLLSVMIVVLDLAAGISIFVAGLFILTSVNLSVLEAEAEFATLKAIGYGHRSIARIVLIETLALAIAAAVLSVPVAMLISIYLNHRMGQAWFHVDSFFFPVEFARVLVPSLVLMPIGAYPGLRHIFNVDIPSAIRARVIE